MKKAFNIKTIYSKYGVFPFIAAILVIIKIGLFYFFMGVSANIVPIFCITAFIIFLSFYMFENKWIPAVLYLLVTLIMFTDVAYSSFFNRYLSIKMLAATGLLADVTASIKEIIKPKFFLLFADCIMIFVTLIYGRRKGKKNTPILPFGALYQDKAKEKKLGSQGGFASEKEAEVWLADFYEIELFDQRREAIDIADGISTKKEREEGEKKIPFRITALSSRKKKAVSTFLILGLVTALLMNPSGSYGIISINNQELFTYHAKDIIQSVTGKEFTYGMNAVEEKWYTGTYEKELQGDLFGVAKGRNLIVVQLESFQNFVIGAEYNGQELTPNLNRLVDGDSIYFDNYYQQVSAGNTSDAEYATNNSLYGTIESYTYKTYEQNTFRGLPQILKNEYGYQTSVFHAYESDFWNRENVYPQLGFDTYYSKDDYKNSEIIGMGLSDKEWYRQSVDYMKEMSQPFYSFMITLSNHHPYQMPEKYREIELLQKDKRTTFGYYVQSINYTDYAIGYLISYLKAAGLYDNSVIAFYGDHHGLIVDDVKNEKSMEEYLGKEYSHEEMMNIPLIIHVPGEDVNRICHVAGGQTDFMPTISYLLGIDKLDTLYIGENLLTADSGFVAEQYYLPKGSFYTDDIVFIMSKDGVFENSTAYNKNTKKSVPLEMCREGYIRALTEIYNSELYLKNNVFAQWDSLQRNLENKFGTKVPPGIIAKAGAPDASLVGTNSLEALEASYQAGYRTIGVDMSWAWDGKTVLLTDWTAYGELFNTASTQVSYGEFMSAEMKNGLTQMDFAMLKDWLISHPDVNVAVALETNPHYLLKHVTQDYPEIKDQIIPVVSDIKVVEEGKISDYPNIILKITEDSAYSVNKLKSLLYSEKIWAVAMPSETIASKYKQLLGGNTFVYAYDVDDATTKISMEKLGVDGIITKVLVDNPIERT